MKVGFALLLACILPYSGYGLNAQNNQFSPEQLRTSLAHVNSMVHPSKHTVTKDRERNWQLKEIIVKDDIYLDSELNITSKETAFYNSDNPAQIDSIIVYYYNINNQAYILASISRYFYDATEEHYIGGDVYLYDSGTYRQQIFEYDSQNRLINEYIFVRYASIGEFALDSRVFYVYSNDNLLMRFQTYCLGTMIYTREIYSHDEQGRINSSSFAYCNDSLSWYNVKQTIYTYNPNDTSTGATYIANLSHEHTINPSCIWSYQNTTGMVDEAVYQNWVDGTWRNYSKHVFEYDAANRYISRTLWEFQTDSAWHKSIRRTIDYDDNGNLIQSSDQKWSQSLNDWWYIYYQSLYTWEQDTANEEQIAPAIMMELTAYPNPFRSSVTLELNSKDNFPIEAGVYNVKGQLIRKYDRQKSKSINWDGKDKDNKPVSNGIYLIKVNQNGHLSESKVIRVK